MLDCMVHGFMRKNVKRIGCLKFLFITLMRPLAIIDTRYGIFDCRLHVLSRILVSWKRVSCHVKSSTPGFVCASFRRFRSLEMWFIKVHEILGWLISCILVASKCDSWRLLRPSAQITWLPMGAYLAFSWPENAIPSGLWDPRLKGTWRLVRDFFTLWQPENEILTVIVHVFMRKTFYQFGILKMRSLRVLRISAHGYLASIKTLFGILTACKSVSSSVM